MLCGPERIGRCRLDQGQPLQVDARRLPGRCIGNKRRSNQHHPLSAGGQAGQAGPEQLQLAAALNAEQHLGERAGRPATAGQCRIQRGMTGGLQALGLCLGAALPDPLLVEQALEAEHRAHQPRLTRPQNTPSMTKS
ncbi:hypothetical protein D3C76_862430 [compost metagenome]